LKNIETANKISSPVNFLEVNNSLLHKFFSSCSPVKRTRVWEHLVHIWRRYWTQS